MDRAARLARGVNLTGWLNYNGGTPMTTADMDVIRGSDLTHVRLTVDPPWLLTRYRSAAFVEQSFAQLDAALDLLLAHDIAVIVDLHAYRRTGRR